MSEVDTLKEIRMVDLKTQYENIKTEIDEAIQNVIDNTAFINGPQVKTFADNLASYLHVNHVVPCANGTDALQIALMALDLQPGDEVITVPYSFISTAEVTNLLKLKPVFVEINKATYTIDVSKIEAAITEKTKCVIPVHLFGQPADMEPLMEIAKKHNLYVVEDTAQALGAEYRFSDGTTKSVGTIGNIGTTSFFPSKVLGCYGDGGALITNDVELAETSKMICHHGSKVKYYHKIVGVNSRLDTIQAAILDVKLKYLDKYYKARIKVAHYYDEALKDIEQIELPCKVAYGNHIFHQYSLTIKENRDELKEFLQNENIPTMIYFPVPFHLQDAFQQYGYKMGDFPISEYLAEHTLSLPIHTEMDEEQLGFISEKVKEFFK
ncbi:MAG: DegT/DnrJ/EryC1/StrS family aminotransferase [Bacteroidia bacterium]|nr:DegT/DnrJ/EryC1/StrS family aminotransferase [Bacteroidia bacterium]